VVITLQVFSVNCLIKSAQVLVDEEERRYFKQQEITLWRKAERPRKPYSLGGGGGGPLPLHHAMARHQVSYL
jgi:hypothetical protein